MKVQKILLLLEQDQLSEELLNEGILDAVQANIQSCFYNLRTVISYSGVPSAFDMITGAPKANTCCATATNASTVTSCLFAAHVYPFFNICPAYI